MVTVKIKTMVLNTTIIVLLATFSAVTTLHLLHVFGGQAFAFFSSTTNEQNQYFDNSADSSYTFSPDINTVASSSPTIDPNAGCGCPGCCAVSKL